MRTAEDLNRAIEDQTGIPDALGVSTGRSMPLFGYPHLGNSHDRLAALLRTEAVNLPTLELRRAINFLMPSTTDFGRSWVGEVVVKFVESPDPRIATLGCSTGLEVYWIAHSLKKQGLLSETGKIMGVDVNESALEIARRGEYDKKHFDRSFYDRESGVMEALTVDEAEQRVRFRRDLKPHADFTHGNLLNLESLFSLGLKDMDIVVLMNVLKYMNPAAQQKALANVKEILREGSILYTDVYTCDLVAEHDSFVPVDDSNRAFRCVKQKRVFGAKRRKQPYLPSIKKENPICLLLKSKGLCP